RSVDTLKAHVGGLGKVGGEGAEAFERRFNRALNRVARNRAIEDITNDFVAAFKASGDLESALVGVEAQLRAIGASDSELGQVARRLDQIGKASRGGDAGNRAEAQSTLRSFGTQLRALPSQRVGGIGTDSVGSIARALDDIDQLKETIKQIPAAAKAAGQAIGVGPLSLIATIGALVLVASEGAKKIAEQRQILGGIIDAQAEYFTLVQTGTTESVNAAIEAKETELAAAQARLDAARAQRDSVNATNEVVRTLAAGVPIISDAASFFSSDLATVNAAIDATNQEFTDATAAVASTETQLAVLNSVLTDGRIAANDLAAAEAELANARERFASVLENTQISAIQESANQTAEQVRQRLTQIENQVRLNDELLASANLSEAKTRELTQANTLLNVEYQTLLQTVLDVKEAEERHAIALQRVADATDAVASAQDDIASLEEETLEKRAAILKKYGDNAIKIAEQAADAADKALQTLQRKLADFDVDFARGEAQAARKAQFDAFKGAVKFQEQEAKALRDHLQRLK
ncbi:MAG TPA: hypothetical protein VKA67_12760, partial [Verrucomicrobiae bacterium]|nr:hypothetical protein [Verrucomicrobiae bacterium]